MKPEGNEMEYAVFFSFTPGGSSLTTPTVSANQNWQRVCIFLCHETVIEGNKESHLFSLPFIQLFNSILSTDSTTFDTRRTLTTVDSTSRILMLLFLSTGWILGTPSCPGNFCF